jgi:hypothetical protein
MSECRADVDCAFGAGTCDVARGRCSGGTPDGGDGCGACDDGEFCNGVEGCTGGVCTASTSPCIDGQSCDEAQDECLTDCEASPDADGDGVAAIRCGGADCDDSDSDRFPDNDERCDASHDEDCNPATFGARDEDGDGAFDVACCNIEGGSQACGTDCNDGHRDVRPGLPEVCNGTDDNCSGATDEGLLIPMYVDVDGDMFGARGSEPTMLCPSTSGYSDVSTDCDDADTSIFPGATETCDLEDDDCDDAVDDGVGTTYYRDADGDRFGVIGTTTVACSAPAGYAADYGDCNDSSAAAHPFGTEVCDGLDNDCSGATDEVLGSDCTMGVGACQSLGRRRCDGTCTAVPGTPIMGSAYMYMPAENGSTDHDCDGIVEWAYSTTCCHIPTQYLGAFASAVDYCRSRPSCATSDTFSGFYTGIGTGPVCGGFGYACSGAGCCGIAPDGLCWPQRFWGEGASTILCR